MDPLRVLLDDTTGEAVLAPPLAALYGPLALARDLLYANFIASLDGVTALVAPGGAGRAIRGVCDADRLVMGLLRSLADAIVIGAGTLRTDRGHPWTPGTIDRERAALYAELGRDRPRLAVVTAHGRLDPAERALQEGALVLTTETAAPALRRALPAACTVRAVGTGRLDPAAILAAVRAEGHRRVLTEGGPTLLAGFAATRLLDELFLTLSPVLAGRHAGDGRLSLVEGVQLLPEDGRWASLRSVRASGSHLFLRYAFDRVRA